MRGGTASFPRTFLHQPMMKFGQKIEHGSRREFLRGTRKKEKQNSAVISCLQRVVFPCAGLLHLQFYMCVVIADRTPLVRSLI